MRIFSYQDHSFYATLFPGLPSLLNKVGRCLGKDDDLEELNEKNYRAVGLVLGMKYNESEKEAFGVFVDTMKSMKEKGKIDKGEGNGLECPN